MIQKKRHNQTGNWLNLLLGTIAASSIATFSMPVKAQIPSSGIQYNEDTLVEFEFKESHGYYRSVFGVIDLRTRETTDLISEVKPFDDYADVSDLNRPSSGNNDTGSSNDFLGTPGNSVPNPIQRYTFRANTQYAFYLKVFRPDNTLVATLYSTKFEQLGSVSNADSAKSEGGLADGVVGERKGVRISWDDTGLPKPGQDRDFDDFIVEAGGFLVTGVPCPRVE